MQILRNGSPEGDETASSSGSPNVLMQDKRETGSSVTLSQNECCESSALSMQCGSTTVPLHIQTGSPG